MVSKSQLKCWDEDGFFILKDFAERSLVDAMMANAIQYCREADGNGLVGDIMVQAEQVHAGRDLPPEDRVSKVFRIHRQNEIFREFAMSAPVVDAVASVLGGNVDCFLSQFIFKTPGAIGQPWHQDSYYFPFSKGPQLGLWLAVTKSTPENGPLWVVPGSHREPVHAAIPDPREVTQTGYVEIVDYDMSDAVQVLMAPGDLLVFHSHLMHKSTDNEADYIRAAMVYHYAEAGTVDLRIRNGGSVPPNQDWMAVTRNGQIA